MRNLFYPILSGLLLMNNGQQEMNQVKPDSGFAVVELFTSEGCSSCPPAESLASEVSKKYPDGVFLLSYHVDYWDHLGWKDPYSKGLYSERQEKYGEFFKLSGIYTPEIIVNGETEMVGSDREKLLKTIILDLRKKSPESISLAAALQGKKIVIHCRHSSLKNCVIQFCMVQKQARSKILKGENAGRILDHTNIVRSIKELDTADAVDSLTIDLPEGLTGSDIFIIAFAQDRFTDHISAVTRAEIE